MSGIILNEAQILEFSTNGVLLIRNFFNMESEIVPIQRSIYEIIGLVMDRHGLEIPRKSFEPQWFDNGYLELLKADRSFGAEIYDVVKQIPAFLRLISSSRLDMLFSQLRGTDLPGIGAASYGIRIDNPCEEMYRSQWHQEFLFQPQSMDGIVIWTPLVEIKENMGPVIVCVGSHKDGLRQVSKQRDFAYKQGAYKIGIVNDEDIVKNYEQIAPLTVPGDLLLMDFLTIHQSGYNVSKRSRWTCQSRFFNFREPNGMKIGWKASVTSGTDIESIFNKYFVR
jgi:hypothetical protein